MTLNDLQRAALVLFAAREAGPDGSLAHMKAICYVIRNRRRAGWAESWLELIETASDHTAHDVVPEGALSVNDRRLQLLARDVDEIFFDSAEDELTEAVADKLYWAFMNRPINLWFRDHVIRNPENNQHSAQIGLMMLYE